MLVAVLASLPVDIDMIKAICPSPFQPPRQIVSEIKGSRVASDKVRSQSITAKASSTALVKSLLILSANNRRIRNSLRGLIELS
jgi:hypothetical protein